MSSVETHYERLLAPIYLWMAGGIDNAVALGASDIADLLPRVGFAVDLGAGFGMHTIPLARAGHKVLAIDSSAYLLEQLRSYTADMPVTVVSADLLRFSEHLPPHQQVDLILCMGDTLTHLPTAEAISELAEAVAATLRLGGRFISTFRDYTVMPAGPSRFIPVQSDSDRIHMCFLEEVGNHVVVHDILHQRKDNKWTMQISNYEKLRISAHEVCRLFRAAGLKASVAPGPRGKVKVVADA